MAFALWEAEDFNDQRPWMAPLNCIRSNPFWEGLDARFPWRNRKQPFARPAENKALCTIWGMVFCCYWSKSQLKFVSQFRLRIHRILKNIELSDGHLNSSKGDCCSILEPRGKIYEWNFDSGSSATPIQVKIAPKVKWISVFLRGFQFVNQSRQSDSSGVAQLGFPHAHTHHRHLRRQLQIL